MTDRDPHAADPAPDDTSENLFGGRSDDAVGSDDPGADPVDGSDAVPAGGAAGGAAASKQARPPAEDTRRSKSTSGSFLRELPVLLLIAFVLAFLLRTFVLQVFYIPSTSMAPTLEIDDRMVVEKLTYLAREPRRGEVVVFEGENFDDFSLDQSTPARVARGVGQFLGVVPANARDFVKRVIGLPGDEIVIEEGQVYVNGQALDEPYVVYPDLSDFGPVMVPDDHLFFLGDNRPNSSDSRRSLGMVPTDKVVGRAAAIIWPLDHLGRLTDVHHELPVDATGSD